MKKKIAVFFIIGILAFGLSGCAEGETKGLDNTVNTDENARVPDHDPEVQTEIGERQTENGEPQAENGESQTENGEPQTEYDKEDIDAFSFADLSRLEFYFSSGAGGWATMLTVDADGNFSGEYFDGNLGETGEDYPNGTMYQCNFSGQFTRPVKVNDHTYSVQIGEMNYEREIGTEEIIDGMRYCYAGAYGLIDATDILIYLPGAPLAKLPEEYRSWVGYYDLSATDETELPFYGLYNEAQQCGFSSYDVVVQVKELVAASEERAASLEDAIQYDTLTQTEYDEKASELYELWDGMLNKVWGVLKQVLDAETMRGLTEEEREWIAAKEQAALEAGAEYEGGSIQSMVMTLKEAELSEARVYELLELLE